MSEYYRSRSSRRQPGLDPRVATPLAEAYDTERQVAAESDAQAKEYDAVTQQMEDQKQKQAQTQRFNLTTAKKRGIETQIDPATGAEDIRRDEAGNPVWQAGFLGGPAPAEDGKPAVSYRDPRGTVAKVPLDKIQRTEDPTGEAFYEFDLQGQDGQSQRVRRPEDKSNPLFKIDPATGNRFTEVQDPTTGAIIPQPLGIDPKAATQAAIKRKKDEYAKVAEKRKFQAEELRLQQGIEETEFKPIKEQLSEAEKAAKAFAEPDTENSGIRYEQRQDGLYKISKMSRSGGMELPTKIETDPSEVAAAQNWIKQKKQAEDNLARIKGEHDPRAQRLQEFQLKRDKLALEALRESQRTQAELADMEEAEKAGIPVFKPDWKQKLDATRKEDARYHQIVAAGEYADQGSDLSEDIGSTVAPGKDDKPAPLSIAQKIFRDLAVDSPKMNYVQTDAPVDIKGTIAKGDERSILDVITSGLSAGKDAPDAQDLAQARTVATQSIGVADPENYTLSKAENGGFNLFRSGEDAPIGRLDPNAKRILLFPSDTVTDAGKELLEKASKDGFPVYRMGGGTPMSAQELRDYVAKGVNIARGAASADEKAAMLAKEGITPADVRDRVFTGKMSVQDGRWLQEKLFDTQEVDNSAEGYANGFKEYLTQNPAQASLFSKGKPEDKAAVVNQFADTRAAQSGENLFLSRTDLATRRGELLQQHAGKGFGAKVGGFVKETLAPMVGIAGQAAALIPQMIAKAAGREFEAGKLADQQFSDWTKRTSGYLTRIREREGMVFAVDELRAWADRARPGEKPPEELAARIAKEVYNGYHELTPDAAKALETSEDTFNVNKDPALSAMMQRYLSTGNDADLSGMVSMLAMDARDRKTQAEVSAYIEAPRAASPADVLERMSPFGLKLDERAAADLLKIRQTMDNATDEAGTTAAIAKAQKILGTATAEDTALALDTLTKKATDDPDSWWGLTKGGFVAGRQELVTELVTTTAEAGLTALTAGGATPEILAARAARTAAKTGIRSALKRSVRAGFDALTDQSRLFAATKSAFNRGRLALGETIAKESDKFAKAGMLTEKFGVPLTVAQKARNLAVGTAKAAAAGAPMEALEEGIASVGEADANLGATVESMAMGAMGAGLITPIFAGATAISNLFTSRRAGREMEAQKAKWVETFNERMSKAPGFKAVSLADYDVWQGLQDNPAHQEAFGEYSTALQDLQAAQETQVEGQPPAPAVLAAQARAESASAKLENLVEVSFSAMDELRAIPEAERPLYTAAAKAAAGAREFTAAEAKALIKQSGNNAAVFQQAETMPAGVEGPRQLKTLADLPAVSTVAPGVYRLPEGVQITLPPALVDTLKQAAPTMVDLMAVSATAAPVQPAPKGKKGAKANVQNQTPAVPGVQGSQSQVSQQGSVQLLPGQPNAQTPQAGTQGQPTGFESFGTVAPAAKGGISVTTTDKAQHAALQKELKAQGIKFAATGTKAKGKSKASYTISFKPKAATPQAQAPAPTPQEAAGVEQVARRVIADTVTRAPKLKGIIKEASKPLKWETGGFWANPDGTVSFHMPTLLPQLAGLDAQTAAKRVAALIDEEIRHVANMEAAKRLWKSGGTNPLGLSFKDWRDAWYGDIWDNHFTDEMRARVEEAYGDTLPPQKWARAMEGLRMLDQLRATGSITEAVLRHLEAVIEALREFLTAATPKIKQEIENIRAVLAEYGYEGGTVKPEKAKKKASKPKEKSTPKSSTQFTLSPSIAKPNTFEPADAWHAKKGKPTYVAKISRRLDASEYAAAKALATKNSGYYSAYNKAGAIPGFQFDTAEDRDAFLSATLKGGDAQPLASAPASTMPRDRAEKILQNLAKKEQDGKLNPQEQSAVAEARGVLAGEQGETLAAAPSRRTPKAKADNQKALKDMIASMRPIWRDTLQATMIDGKSIAEFAQERGLPEETVGRILRDATGRLQFLQRTAEKGLKPTVQVEDDKVKASSGRPDLAMSGNATFAAVDQMRATPEEVTHAEMQDMAESMFAADPQAAEKLVVRWMDSGTTVLTTDGMPDSIKNIVDAAQARSAAEMLMTAAAKMLVTEKALSGGNSTQIARLIDLYRNTGTEQARALNMRRDPHTTPEERAAMYLSEVLLTPPESMRNEIRRNPANKERILAAWASQAEQIKADLKAEGYDLDETFAEFRKEQKLAEAAIPKEVKVPLAKTTTKTRKLVKAVLEGKTWRDAATAAGMTLDAARAAYNTFRSTLNQAGIQAAQMARDELLRSAPAGDFASQLGLPEWLEDSNPDTSPVQTQATEALKKQRERKKKAGEINLANPVAVVRAKRSIEQRKSNTFDKISEFWRASILSGPQTHVVNVVSGLAYGAYEASFKKLAVGAQADVARMFGMNPDAASLADIPAMIAATLPAIKSAFIDSVRAWQTESRLFDSYTKGQNDAMNNADAFKEAYEPALKGMVGKVMRGISFRAMGAADEFVKSFFTRIEIAAQARQIARSKGLSGKAMADEIAYQLTPGSESWVRALEQAKKITFQTEIGSKTGTIDKLDNLARMISETKKGRYGMWLKGLSHFVFPFVDTPTNIFKAGVTMSPIGSMLALVDATRSLNQRRKGNKEEAQRLYNAARAFDDIVNQTVAWGFILAFSEMVKPGDDEEELPFITGTIPWRSTSKGEREVAYRTAPPQSIRIGGQWYSYKRLDPFASALAFTVDSIKEFQSGKPIDEVWGQVGLSMMRNMQDKTFLQGVSDLFNAINDPERFATKWATGIATGFIPNLIRQPIRTYDPIIRDSDLPNDMPFWENLGRRVGYGVVPQYAPPAFDVWGREATKNTGTGGPNTDWLLRLFSPVDARDADNVDPLDVAILRYNMKAEKPLGIIAPSREIRREVNGQTVSISLTDAQREEMARKSGQAARLAIGGRFNGQDLTEDDAEAIQAVVQQSQRLYRELAFRQAMQDRK